MRRTVLPRWARAILAVDRVVEAVRSTEKIVRDELFLMLTRPEERCDFTIAIYDDNKSYLPGSKRRGLFDWEVRILCRPDFPHAGRILLGAAGGGRELEALTRMGYTVDAFEPAPQLLEGARSIVRAPGSARVLHGDYAALVEATHGRGTLAAFADGTPYDAVILGWGSFSHVHTREERHALLVALRTLCPRGPVLISFVTRPDEQDLTPLQRLLRERVARYVRRGDPSEEAVFTARAGFFAPFDRARVTDEASAAGYRVALYAEQPDAHALLTPR